MKDKKNYIYEMDPVLLNILSVVLIVIMVLLTIGIIDIFNIELKITEKTFVLFYFLLIPYLVIHEILHAIGYVVNGADFKKITFGVHLEKGVLCCSCKQEVGKKTILWSLMYPFLFIGVITYIIGLITGNTLLILLSILNISGCTGDLVMFYAFLGIKDFKFFEYDNPLGFGIITKENMDNKKLLGLKRMKDEKIVQTTDKKVSVSKTSIIALVIYYIIGFIDFFLY